MIANNRQRLPLRPRRRIRTHFRRKEMIRIRHHRRTHLWRQRPLQHRHACNHPRLTPRIDIINNETLVRRRQRKLSWRRQHGTQRVAPLLAFKPMLRHFGDRRLSHHGLTARFENIVAARHARSATGCWKREAIQRMKASFMVLLPHTNFENTQLHTVVAIESAGPCATSRQCKCRVQIVRRALDRPLPWSRDRFDPRRSAHLWAAA